MSRLITPEFIVNFPNVFEAKLNDLSGKEEYSIVALFPKGIDLSGLRKAAVDAARKKWPNKLPKDLRSPFRDQGERIDACVDEGKPPPAGYEKEAIFMNLKSKNKPRVVFKNNKDITEVTDFYSGCWAIASLSVYAYDMKGNKGVAFGLGNLQKQRDGESLGGVTKPEDDFEAVEMSEDEFSGGADSSDPASAEELFT